MSTDASWLETMPEAYDRCLGPALFAPFSVELAGRVTALASQRVLELAAGTGIASAALVRALPAAEITATDLNPAMVSWGSARVPGATWLRADAQSLEFPDGSFDLVGCQPVCSRFSAPPSAGPGAACPAPSRPPWQPPACCSR